MTKNVLILIHDFQFVYLFGVSVICISLQNSLSMIVICFNYFGVFSPVVAKIIMSNSR